MLSWTVSKNDKGQFDPTMPKTLLNVTSTFCEGYGIGIIGKVLKSPYKELIGTSFRVDMRNAKYFGQYASKIKIKKD